MEMDFYYSLSFLFLVLNLPSGFFHRCLVEKVLSARLHLNRTVSSPFKHPPFSCSAENKAPHSQNPSLLKIFFLTRRQSAERYSLLGKRKAVQSFHRMEEESGAAALLMRLYIGKHD